MRDLMHVLSSGHEVLATDTVEHTSSSTPAAACEVQPLRLNAALNVLEVSYHTVQLT